MRRKKPISGSGFMRFARRAMIADRIRFVEPLKNFFVTFVSTSGGSLLINSVNSVNSALFRKNSAEF